MAAEATDAGAAYSQLISDQLAEERTRKSSLEARGVTVITTSGTLATLLFALTAGLTSVASFKLPGGAKLPLLLALVAFIVAAVCGLTTNMPLKYREATPQGLARLVDARYWTAPGRGPTAGRRRPGNPPGRRPTGQQPKGPAADRSGSGRTGGSHLPRLGCRLHPVLGMTTATGRNYGPIWMNGVHQLGG